MARIVWIADDDASGQIADVYRELKQTSLKGNALMLREFPRS